MLRYDEADLATEVTEAQRTNAASRGRQCLKTLFVRPIISVISVALCGKGSVIDVSVPSVAKVIELMSVRPL